MMLNWVRVIVVGLVYLAGCVPDTTGQEDDMGVPDVGCQPFCDAAVDAPPPTECADGEDNDGDGLVDYPNDPACTDAEGDDESADPPPPQCSNEVDDDGDGDVDLADRGCARPGDDDESDEPPLPNCSNGLDDDMDGRTDFPADPGCGSPDDLDETDEDVAPVAQCGNGLDDDNDGRIDLSDPGCASLADPRETDPEETPACANGLDDDEDGVIDFPLEPGCAAAGDQDETDGPNPPACGNGLDDDGDDVIDYPWEPGCAGVGDRDETDPQPPPHCADGRDNDRDGRVDYPEDLGCQDAADGTETAFCGRNYDAVEAQLGQTLRGTTRGGHFSEEGTCGGRGATEVVFMVRVDEAIETLRVSTDLPDNTMETVLYIRRSCLDQDSEVACAREELDDVAANQVELHQPAPGSYYVYLDGATGASGDFAIHFEGVPLPQCRNGDDDDDDGRVDFPSDPGCIDDDDPDETTPDPPPACGDDEDNDADGLIDFPLDIGCRAASDDDETDVCGQGQPVQEYPVGEPFILDDTSMGGSDAFTGSCGNADGTEKIFVYTNPFNAQLRFSVNHEETEGPTTLYIRRECLNAGSEIVCDAARVLGGGQKGTVTIERAPPGDLYVFVDHPFGLGHMVKLSVEVERLPPGCSDGVDNDDDGFADEDDPGCADEMDEDERDLEELSACWDELDNDEDGLVDYPNDPGCRGKGDVDEADPAEAPACANGLDDDDDGNIDFPFDPGCTAMGDDDEALPRPAPECRNSRDDDMDGYTDFPFDPGCSGAGDLSERTGRVAQCSNAADDDRDGLVDYPFDPGCFAAGDPVEVNPEVPAACSNGVDDDEDGVADFPREPGCTAAGDDDESNPNFPPQCANDRDDDNNGRIDFPDDPGCRFAGDPRENSEGALPSRCADGVDNDDDGVVDLADVGCINARDNDEDDPAEAPACADDVDNDEDGAVDWPDDDGCAAQGDVCEQLGHGLCDDACTELLTNPLHCGRCGRACSEGVECNDGRCGELRERVHICGRTGRNVQEFIRGDLQEAEVIVEANNCNPGDDVQAILVSRGGIATFEQNIVALREYVNNGGVVLTEYNISHRVYSRLLERNVNQGQRNGRCSDNVQPNTQFTPGDPFWRDNVFASIGANNTGCGYSIGHFPDLVPLGGWDANNVSLGYVDIGSGRLWVVESDWQDNQASFTDTSRDLMAYMIANGTVIGP